MPQSTFIYLTHGSGKTDDRIHSYGFDDFGRYAQDDRGAGKAADMVFTYDMHGWLTEMKSQGGFKQNLYYYDSDRTPRYDGSISAMSWNIGDDIKSIYHYSYDGLNRLKEAGYTSDIDSYSHGYDPEHRSLIPMTRLKDNYSTSYRYDKNCNITLLERMGTTNTKSGEDYIDILEMDYSGNQLKKVRDCADETLNYAGAFDFQDKSDNDSEYSYDANGAMTEDLNKGITDIQYDKLEHPVRIRFSNDNYIEYVYAADGRKLRTIHATANGKSSFPKYRPRINYLRDTTDYVNVYEFKNGKPSKFKFKDGFYSFDKDGNLDGCHLYVQDYQCNIRMVVNAHTDSVEQINHYYPYGALIGDISTNQNFQNDRYSGKELDRKFGLDRYDFEARQQDPLLGRFTSIDPMAEKYYSISPYAYCAGDPINIVDPTGKDIYNVTSKGYIRKYDGTACLGTYLIFDHNIVELSSSENSYDAVLDGLTSSTNSTFGLMTAEQALTLQNVMTQGTEVEWEAQCTESGLGLLMTSHDENMVKTTTKQKALDKTGIDKQDVMLQIHGHPGYNAQDGSTSEGTRGGSPGDVVKAKINPNRRFFVNHQGSVHVYEYDANNSCINEWDSFDEWRKDLGM